MSKETYTHIKREKENKSSLELLEIVMYGNEHQRAIGEVDQAYEDLKQALTPPTEQEVCEALGEFLNKKVYYEESPYIVFSLGLPVTSDNYIIERQDNGTIVFNLDILEYYPPHLITLIGRFYEGRATK